MQVIGRIIILAACVFTAYAVPHMHQLMVPKVISQNALGKVQAEDLTSNESNCLQSYNDEVNQINGQLSEQIDACVDASNQSLSDTQQQVDFDISMAQGNLTSLQQNLNTCTSITNDTDVFISCVQNTFNENLKFMDVSNALVNQAENLLTNGQAMAQTAQNNCVSSVMGHAKSNISQAANTLDKCLQNAVKIS